MSQGLIIEGFKLRPVAEALAEAQRELQVRVRCYPKWIPDGKVSAFDANERFQRLTAAVEYLERLAHAVEDETTVATLQNLGLIPSVGGDS